MSREKYVTELIQTNKKLLFTCYYNYDEILCDFDNKLESELLIFYKNSNDKNTDLSFYSSDDPIHTQCWDVFSFIWNNNQRINTKK